MYSLFLALMSLHRDWLLFSLSNRYRSGGSFVPSSLPLQFFFFGAFGTKPVLVLILGTLDIVLSKCIALHL